MSAASMNKFGSSQMIIETSNKKSGLEFFILRAKLAFIELKQVLIQLQLYLIWIQNVKFKLELIYPTMSLEESLVS